jgi:NAD(P)-dependent dehydrogenase (short-subunit alcohol dehydrogenase family)
MGQTIAPLFASEGARVAVADLDPQAASALAEAIRSKGGQSLAVPVDVVDEQQVAALMNAVSAEWGKLDILVNCAAITEFLPAEQITGAQFRRMIAVDLGGVFYCCQQAGKRMIRQNGGKIVNFGSTAGLAGVPYMAHYTAAKHGVVGLTRALAAEWGKYNINVNCICPGATMTPMLLGSTTEAYRAERIGRTPLNRLATPDDQARVALFLASSDADYVTGNIVCTDGGIYALAASTSEGALRGDAFRKKTEG